MNGTLAIPGFVNAHTHTFQRALRGRAAGRDFWAWREGMLAEVDRLTPDTVRTLYRATYREMLAAGWTAVAEFHYIGIEEAFAAAEAAAEAGIQFVCLHVAYARGGVERMRQPSVAAYLAEVERLRAAGLNVGVAPHSVRACPRDWLAEIGAYAVAEGLVFHIHADEQPREVEECLAEHGLRPIELLAETGCLTDRTTIVHGTHASESELALLQQHGSTVCVCPTTESDLGDGFLAAVRMRELGIPLCVGTDSNVRIDPLEEIREIEAIARRQSGTRLVYTTDELLAIGRDHGASAIGLTAWDDTEVDLAHRSLAGVAPTDIVAALVAGCSGEAVLGQRV